jgi:hypothetical protein
MLNGSTLMLRDFAEQLLAGEAATASEHADLPVAFRVCNKLRLPLITLAGSAGFQSLLSRAITLAKREAPGLSTLRINADGSMNRLASPVESGHAEPRPDKLDAQEGVILVAHIVGLLFTFIGEALTLRLINDIWPKKFLNRSASEGTAKHERNG